MIATPATVRPARYLSPARDHADARYMWSGRPTRCAPTDPAAAGICLDVGRSPVGSFTNSFR